MQKGNENKENPHLFKFHGYLVTFHVQQLLNFSRSTLFVVVSIVMLVRLMKEAATFTNGTAEHMPS